MTIRPYGSWKSPITSEAMVAGVVGIGTAVFDGEDIYWLESRPQEGGRSIIVRRRPDGTVADIIPSPFNARSRVHEYGGAAFTVRKGTVYFANFTDQRVYRTAGAAPEPVTPESPMRYADFAMAPGREHLIAVREEHSDKKREPANALVWLDPVDRGVGTVAVEGNDFYSSPRFNADGTRLAWLTWSHPNMPWDGSELWVADVRSDGTLVDAELVAGGPEESVFQPEWSPDGVLHFVSDRTGWWNLYRAKDGRIEALCPRESEFGLPQWVFGMTTYGFESAGSIVCSYRDAGRVHLARLDTESGDLAAMETPYTEIENLCVGAGQALYQGGAPERQAELVNLDLGSGKTEILRRSSTLEIEPAFLSGPEAIEFPTKNGNGATAYAFFYPPKNDRFQAPKHDKPPLLVLSQRRTHRRHRYGVESRHPVLDQPRHRGGRCELWREHRLRSRLSRAIKGPLGHRGRGRLGERGEVFDRRGTSGSESPRYPRWERRWLYDAGRSNIPRSVQSRRFVLRHRRPGGSRS